MRLMDEGEVAWFTGLFEGEGNISFAHKHSVQLRLAMTDLDVIERVHKMTDCGSIIEMPPPKAHPRWKVKYRWVATHKQDVVPLLTAMIPLLGERRQARAIEALGRLEKCQDHPRRI